LYFECRYFDIKIYEENARKGLDGFHTRWKAVGKIGFSQCNLGDLRVSVLKLLMKETTTEVTENSEEFFSDGLLSRVRWFMNRSSTSRERSERMEKQLRTNRD